MAQLRFFMDGGNMFTAIDNVPGSVLQFQNLEVARDFAQAMRLNNIGEHHYSYASSLLLTAE